MILYLIGVFIFGLKAYKHFLMLQQTKLKDGISLLNAKPEMKPYLISYAVLWPYHLFLKSNPIELISETFFKHYGDEGHYYLGTRGIKNFFNDLLRGKNRYKNFIIKTDIFEIHKNSKIFEDHEKHFEKLDCLYVKIISGRLIKNIF